MRVTALCLVVAMFVLLPAAAFAQATLTGVVKDSSGTVLPGVTVEASSPALIEKVRSVATDADGRSRVVDLRPGAYTRHVHTSWIQHRQARRRRGLSGTFTATVNADLRVGALEETITVTGESPIVDVQSVRAPDGARQRGLSLSRVVLQSHGDDRRAGAQHRDEHGVRIELTLPSRPQDGREDLLGLCANWRAIPATTFRVTTAGRIACSARQLVASMVVGSNKRVKSAGHSTARCAANRCTSLSVPGRQAATHPLDQMTTRDSDPVGRHAAIEMPVAQSSACWRSCAHRRRRSYVDDRQRLPRPPQQMRETGLMHRRREAPVRGPAIADEDAGEVLPEQGGGLRIPPATLDRVHGGVRCGDRPEPVQAPSDPPPGFVGRDDGAAPNLLTQRGIRGLRLTCRPMHGVHQAAARHREPVLLVQQRRDLAERQAELLIQDDGERDGLCPKLSARGAERVRRLQRMPTLDTPTTPATAADVELNG